MLTVWYLLGEDNYVDGGTSHDDDPVNVMSNIESIAVYFVTLSFQNEDFYRILNVEVNRRCS